VNVFIPVVPVPASRPRVSKWGTYYGKTYKLFRSQMRAWLEKHWTPRPFEIERGPLVVTVFALVPKPKTTKRSWPKGDVDNYAKAVLDALNGWVWEDDDQILTLHVYKQWVDRSRAGIRIHWDAHE
jgi:Holliday junction resolvase RusA-like endonuclease